MGRAGKRETRPLPLSPFPLPRDMVLGLYKTESKRDFVREYVFLKFIQIILLRFGKKTFERKNYDALFYKKDIFV